MDYFDVVDLAETVRITPDEQKPFKEYEAKKRMLTEMYGEPVDPELFFYEVFPWLSFEADAGNQGDGKANGILRYLSEEPQTDADGKPEIDPKTGEQAINYRWHNVIIYDDHQAIKDHLGDKFCVTSPLSYFGKRPTEAMASKVYGFAFDVDGVDILHLDTLIYQTQDIPGARKALIPKPTYIISSGHGVHLYYLLKEPIPLYSEVVDENLQNYKFKLTEYIWNGDTSTEKKRQKQGIFQPFRMPGTQSKLGAEYPVIAFKTGEKVDVDYLNSFLHSSDQKYRIDLSYRSKSGFNLAQWKEKSPEWYHRRIELGIKKGTKGSKWHVKRALYDWWLRQINEKAEAGHRYSCMRVLAAYAVKCDIRKEEAIADAMALLPTLNERKRNAGDVFTQRDIYDAFRKMYSPNYNTFSRKVCEAISGIPMPANKRNKHREGADAQAEHVKLMNYKRDEILGMKDTWRNKDGRPNVEWRVKQFQKNNPNGTKKECQEFTGLDRKTIRKWWNEPPRKYTRKPKEPELVLTGYTVEEVTKLTQEGKMLTIWEEEKKKSAAEAKKASAAAKAAERKRDKKAAKNKSQKTLFSVEKTENTLQK